MKGQTAVFSSGEALRFGWEQTLANLKPLLVLGLVGGALSVLSQGLSGQRGAFPSALVVQVAELAVGFVMIRVLLGIHDGRRFDLRGPGLFAGFGAYLLSVILVGFIVSVGVLLLIIPGVLWALRYGLAPLLVVDEGLRPVEALRESGELTEGLKVELLGFVALALGVNLLGALALGLGLLVTVPTTGLAAIFVLRKLQGRRATLPSAVAPGSTGPLPPLVTS